MIILTGCSSNHLTPQLQMLRTVLAFEPELRVILFDLGLVEEDYATIKDVHPNVEIRKFDFEKRPDWFDITKNAGEYAWKPTIIWEAMREYKADVFWLDAGCNLTGRLDAVKDILSTIGFYSPQSQGRIVHWTHQETSKQLDVPEDKRHSTRNLSGGVVAASWKVPAVRHLVCRWALMCAQKHIVAPHGSSRENHRQDQAVLTSLVVNMQSQGKLPDQLEGRLLSISLHNE